MALDSSSLTVVGANSATTFISVQVDGIDYDPASGEATLRISGSESKPDRFSPIVEDYYIDIYVNGSLEKEERQGTARPPSDVSVAASPGDDIRVTITVNEGWNDIDPAELNVTVPEIELTSDDINVTSCTLDPEGEVSVGRLDSGEAEEVWTTVTVNAENTAEYPASVRIAMTIDGDVRDSPTEQFTDTKTLDPGQSAEFSVEVKVQLQADETERTHDLGYAIQSVTAA
jgi:hypothetical protein